MANEITVTQRLQVNDGNYFKIDEHVSAWRDDLTVADGTTPGTAGVQEIAFGTGDQHEVLEIGDLSTYGWAYFRNIDTTNFVEIGLDVGTSFYKLIKLLPGQSALFPLATGAIYARTPADHPCCR